MTVSKSDVPLGGRSTLPKCNSAETENVFNRLKIWSYLETMEITQ